MTQYSPARSPSNDHYLCRCCLDVPGPIGMHPHASGSVDPGLRAITYSYSISGAPGALGGMFLTAAMKRLPGTWYDYTGAVNQFRQNEARLGSSEFADPEFGQMAGRISSKLKTPAGVSVNVHFAKKGTVETIRVRGRGGTRSFRFDLDEAKRRKQPKGADGFQPLYDAIDQLIKLVLEVR